ncbi:glycosyltransferase family 2 protein [Catellatospora sichuanensis]|uniref:glycosyltransferase family 2 protein n=1 Tax=Catellatospora sichuanensis TaxID=1969805 RepID=UPI002482891D|nr:glycosyltransferase family 2 protein [Catellatospora sichuanensis]
MAAGRGYSAKIVAVAEEWAVYKELVVAVVVPAHNEQALIATTISTMPDFVDHIIVVDDCSTDETSQRARSVGDPRVTLIRHERNTGVGGSILDGHRLALELKADVSVVMAGDAQMDPAHLPRLLDPIAADDVEFTKANRFYSRNSFQGMPKLRVFGSVILSFMTKAASGYWHLFDPQNGYTAISRDALERIDLDSIAQRYEFENDLLINLNIADVRAKDVPVPARYGTEVSGMKLHKVIPRISWLLWRGFWRRMVVKHVLRSFSPIALLFLSGSALLTVGGLIGAYITVVRFFDGVTPSAGTVLLAVAPCLVGIHLVVNSLLLDIQEAPDHPSRTGPQARAARER